MAQGKELKRTGAEGKNIAPLSFFGRSPRFEVLEKDGNLVVRGELPGLEKKDVKVNVADGALTIEGEQRTEREENRDGWFTSERSYSSFSRRFPLPKDVDASKCDTRFEDGVLEVTLKKSTRH
jgi:HSP20 family protein